MRAIILAAGRSVRLRPLTQNTPKCLLSIGKKKIIEHQIETLSRHQITDIVVVVGFQRKKIINYLKNRFPKLKFTFVYNEKYRLTNAAYSLWLAKEYLNGSCIYLNSDVFFHPQILLRLKNAPLAATAVQRVPWDEEEVNIAVTKSLAIKKIGKQVPADESYGEFIGVTKFSGQFNKKLVAALNQLLADKKNLKKFAADAINLTIQKFRGQMRIVDVTDLPAIEIDTTKDYEHAHTLAEFYRE